MMGKNGKNNRKIFVRSVVNSILEGARWTYDKISLWLSGWCHDIQQNDVQKRGTQQNFIMADWL